MKKVLLLSLTVFIATSLSAQFYAGFGVGYGMGASKRVNGREYTDNSRVNIYGSYGEGFNANLKLGFMFSENIGFELGTSYLIGSSQTKEKSEYILQEAKSSGLRLAPQLVIKLDNGLYSRFGMIVPVMGKTVITNTNDHYDPTGFGVVFVKQESTMEAKGSFSMGFIGAIGYAYALSDNMDLFAEVEYIGMSIKSGSAKLTQYDVDGKDQLEGMKTFYKEYEFVDEVTSDDNKNMDEAGKGLKQKAPFSSIGLNIGIVMKF